MFLELCCGTKSITKCAEKRGIKCYTVDNDPQYNPTLVADITALKFDDKFDVIWASPPCQGFSVAAIGKNWHKDTREPKTDSARLGLSILDSVIRIISEVKPRKWYIENPRGMMRKVIDEIFKKYGITYVIRHTVTYCQYGENRMKPTDIWTNDANWKPKPACKNGDPCHEAAPRGSRTGTQGIKGAIARGKIPPALCNEVLDSCIY